MALQSEKRLIPAGPLPDDLVLRILILLPGKDISRCKCVCKSWLSLIRSPIFREIHRNHHGSLMLYYSKNAGCVPSGDSPAHLFRFYCSPLRRLKDPSETTVKPMTELSIPTGIFFDQGIRIVNGLVCVATSQKGSGVDVQLTIYNVCTGERMTIPDPIPYVSTLSSFHLGYDPASRTYKLLRLIFRQSKNVNGQAMDLGNTKVRANIMTLRPSGTLSKWRKLNYEAACVADISMRWVYGLYNMVRSENCNGGLGIGKRKFSGDDGVLCWFPYHGDHMILFDLNKEKFRRLRLPAELAGSTAQVVGSRAEFKECGRLGLTLWMEHFSRPDITVPRVECFVSEEDEGGRWSKQYCRKYPMEVPNPADLVGMAMGSSDPGEILFMIPFVLPGAVYCYSYRLNKVEEFWAGNYRSDPCFKIDGTPSYLGDSNHLYMSLRDVLRGVF